MDKPTRTIYVIAAFLALTQNIDFMFRTPVGAAIWCGVASAFAWPLIRFERPWLSGTVGAIGAGLIAYAIRLLPTVGTDEQRFIAELIVFAVMAVLGYLFLVRGYWNPYKKPRH